MFKLDRSSRKVFLNKKRFMDYFNVFVFHQEHIIDEANLQECSPVGLSVNAETGELMENRRDVFMKEIVTMTDGRVRYSLYLGLEPQKDIDYSMPVRNMGYDYANYQRQIADILAEEKANSRRRVFPKGRCLEPNITSVLYLGEKPWDAPLSLRDMFPEGIDKSVMDCVQDYSYHLMRPEDMTPEQETYLVSDLRQIFGIIKTRGNGEEMHKLVMRDPAFQDMDPDAARFIREVTNIYVPFQKTERGTVNMCKAIQEIEQKGKQEERCCSIQTIFSTVERLTGSSETAFQETCRAYPKNSPEEIRRIVGYQFTDQ